VAARAIPTPSDVDIFRESPEFPSKAITRFKYRQPREWEDFKQPSARSQTTCLRYTAYTENPYP